LDRQVRILAGKLQYLVDRAKQFLRLFGRDDGFGRSLCGAGALARGALTWRILRLRRLILRRRSRPRGLAPQRSHQQCEQHEFQEPSPQLLRNRADIFHWHRVYTVAWPSISLPEPITRST